jgi:DNA-binding CsgD family transcriptional regulator
MSNPRKYDLFFRFIEAYRSAGYKGINPDDPLILELEEMMENNEQFFYLGDLINIKILYSSKRSKEMMGVEPADLTLYHFFEATHPDDVKRNSLGRATLLKLANDLFVAEKGFKLLSSNLRIRNPVGNYTNLLMQLYLFYSTIPYKSVFFLKIHTNINWFKKLKHGYHYYLGEDLSYFKYPDEEMLMTGNIFSDREFEIIRLIESGLSSEQISEKLFLSLHTVNTHRRNILKKTGKAHISDLIYDLKERGLL